MGLNIWCGMIGGRTPTSGGGLGNSWGCGRGRGSVGLRWYIYVMAGTKGGNPHLVSAETVWSQRTPQAKGVPSPPPQPSPNQKQSLTLHAPSSRPAAALPAAQSLSAQVDMHIYTRSKPLAIVLSTIMQRSPLAYRRRQCPDRSVRRRACQLVTFFPLLRLSFRSSSPLLICLHWQFGGLYMPCSIRSIHPVDIRMITPASMNMFISMTIPVKLSR